MLGEGKPNLFVIGAPKCGTTLVHSILRCFPGVHMSAVKEPGFFDRDDAYAKGIAWYSRTFFRGYRGERWVGEATPWTIYSPAARDRIVTVSPEARFVVCLRDPAARAVSMYFDQVSAGTESRGIEAALSVRVAPSARIENDYLRGSAYVEALSPWLEAIPADRLLILTEKELAHNGSAAGELARLLDETAPETFDLLATNAASVPRSRRLVKFIRRVEASESRGVRAVRRLAPDKVVRLLSQAVVKANSRTAAERPAAPAAVTEELRRYFADDVLKTERLIQRDLSHWPSHPENHGAP